MFNLKKPNIEEADEILDFYRSVIISIEDTQFKPKWSEKYPDFEYIKTSIGKGELYICKMDGGIISCVVLNDGFDPDYENVSWLCNAESDEILVIHAFAVASGSSGKGVGREIFSQIKDDAIKNNQKTIRIDIIDGNEGACKVFEKFGFEYVDTVEIVHDIVGLEKFHLFEYVLKNNHY